MTLFTRESNYHYIWIKVVGKFSRHNAPKLSMDCCRQTTLLLHTKNSLENSILRTDNNSYVKFVGKS